MRGYRAKGSGEGAVVPALGFGADASKGEEKGKEKGKENENKETEWWCEEKEKKHRILER